VKQLGASFTEVVKGELVRRAGTHRADCPLVEILGFFLLAAEREGGGFVLLTENAAVARAMYHRLRGFGVVPELVVESGKRLRKRRRYLLRLGDADVLHLFSPTSKAVGAEVRDSEGPSPLRLARRFLRRHRSLTCRRAFLRGAFLARGTVSDPKSHPYHLEFVAPTEEAARLLREVAYAFSLHFKEILRRGNPVLYLKDVEEIVEFLRVVESTHGVLELEDARAIKELKSQVNRLVNGETANVAKTIEASMRQIEAIRTIERTVGLASLPSALREIAEARLAHPEVSLAELGRYVPSGPIGKSGVNHRMRRLIEIARRLHSQVARENPAVYNTLSSVVFSQESEGRKVALVTKLVTIRLHGGLRARSAARFVQQANRFRANVYLERGNHRVNAKSIMGVMGLALAAGEEVVLVADGPDAEEAVAALAKFLSHEYPVEV